MSRPSPQTRRTSRSSRRGARTAAVLTVAGLAGGVLAGCGAGVNSIQRTRIPPTDSAVGQIGDIKVRNAYIAPPPGPSYPQGSSAPLYATIINVGSAADALTGATSDESQGVALLRVTGGPGTATPTGTGTGTPTGSPTGTPTGTPPATPTGTATPTAPRAPGSPGGAAATSGAPVAALPLPAGARTDLAPGGHVLVLQGLRAELFPGSYAPVTFTFREAGRLTLRVPVRLPPPAEPKPTPTATGGSE